MKWVTLLLSLLAGFAPATGQSQKQDTPEQIIAQGEQAAAAKTITPSKLAEALSNLKQLDLVYKSLPFAQQCRLDEAELALGYSAGDEAECENSFSRALQHFSQIPSADKRLKLANFLLDKWQAGDDRRLGLAREFLAFEESIHSPIVGDAMFRLAVTEFNLDEIRAGQADEQRALQIFRTKNDAFQVAQ